jgi:hypothetical protein
LNTTKKFELSPDWKYVSTRQLIADLRCVARKLRRDKVTQKLYDKHGKYNHRRYYTRFGSWLDAQYAAGLEQSYMYRVSAEELFSNLKKVWLKLGRQPRLYEMKRPFSKFKGSVYLNIFGTWFRALKWFTRHANNPQLNLNGQLPRALRIKFKQYQKRSRWINKRLRYEVFRRDKNRCRICGRSPLKNPNVILHIDHLKPLSKGGRTIFSNLRTLCSHCNLGKSDT